MRYKQVKQSRQLRQPESLLFFLLALLTMPYLLVTPVFAQAGAKYGLNDAAKAAQLSTSDTVPNLTGVVIGSLLSIAGVFFFLLMTYGGFLWMTARGNEEQTKHAMNTITAAVIGILVVIGSYALTTFILGATKSS